MKSGLWKIVILLSVLFLLAVTNPSRGKHQEALGEKAQQDVAIPGVRQLGKLYAGLFDYKDFVICSWTEFDGKVRSFGIAGLVITID